MTKLAVHAYVSEMVHMAFDNYRAEIGLPTNSALLSLLVLRELNIKRLSPALVEVAPDVIRDCKITANLSVENAQSFYDHADALSQSHSRCAASLIERELGERWLLAALHQ